jgi:hypothetical protein
MPWTGRSFREKHNHKLTPAQARKAARIATGMVNAGEPEGLAIATANARAEGHAPMHHAKPFGSFSPGGYEPNEGLPPPPVAPDSQQLPRTGGAGLARDAAKFGPGGTSMMINDLLRSLAEERARKRALKGAPGGYEPNHVVGMIPNLNEEVPNTNHLQDYPLGSGSPYQKHFPSLPGPRYEYRNPGEIFTDDPIRNDLLVPLLHHFFGDQFRKHGIDADPAPGPFRSKRDAKEQYREGVDLIRGYGGKMPDHR